MIFDRLAIGTANWGKEYNGAKVSEDDQKRILDYAQCSGIDMIDTATAYEWDWRMASSYFQVVVKVRRYDNVKPEGRTTLMAHDAREFEYSYGDLVGSVSMYEPTDIRYVCDCYANIIQVPYSIYDRRFESRLGELKALHCNEIHVRSIFLRGKLLEKFSPTDCIMFCLMNRNIDRVIIGVDSYTQLKENLRPLHRMSSAEISDLDIIDPRRWK